jgi:hypothetical protein
MTAWLDRVLDRWLDDPRSDRATLVVGVALYFLIWALMAGGFGAALMLLWSASLSLKPK